mgnify:CR=1 FL=1
MKNIPRNKQTTFIIIVIAIGLLLGGLILVSDPKGAQNEESGKGHAETKAVSYTHLTLPTTPYV